MVFKSLCVIIEFPFGVAPDFVDIPHGCVLDT